MKKIFIIIILLCVNIIYSADLYYNAAFEEAKNNGYSRSVCKVTSGDGGYGSGVLVEYNKKKFIITAKHVTNPTSVVFTYDRMSYNSEFINTQYDVKKFIEFEPGVKFNADNDLSILFLKGYPGDITPLTLCEEPTQGHQELDAYGYGNILQKGIFRYSHVSSGQLAKIKVHSGDIDRNPNPLVRLFHKGSHLVLRSCWNPETLEHPITSGFSGGPIINQYGELLGISHKGSLFIPTNFGWGVVSIACLTGDLALGYFAPKFSLSGFMAKLGDMRSVPLGHSLRAGSMLVLAAYFWKERNLFSNGYGVYLLDKSDWIKETVDQYEEI